MKQDLAKNLTGSLDGLQKEILKIRAEQGRLESLGKASEAEQRRVDQSLGHSAELLQQYKA